MTKPTFDPAKPLVMAAFRTVNGHGLNAGNPILVSVEPAAFGEVDEATARRLWLSGAAVYQEDHRPTPVETPEQEKARLAAEALRDADGGDVVMPDLQVWAEDDRETGKKAGARVTRDDLIAVAAREGVPVEPGDTKADLARKITAHRAQALVVNSTNTEAATGLNPGLSGAAGATAPVAVPGTDRGLRGDSHGAAGEGGTDAP